MRIDSHHSYSERYPLGHLESILKRNRFDGSVLVSADADAPKCGFVKGVVVRAGESLRPDAVEALASHPWVKGICLHGNGDADLLREVERCGLPLDLDGGLAHVPGIAARFPRLRVVLDHVGAPAGIDDYTEWAHHLERAAACPGVHCKLSGLTRLGDWLRPCVRRAFALFGPARLMFGSDWPNCLPDYTWKANLAAFTQAIGAQPIEVREELLGGTAARFYAL